MSGTHVVLWCFGKQNETKYETKFTQAHKILERFSIKFLEAPPMDTLINLVVCPHGLTDLWEYSPVTLVEAYGGGAILAMALPDKVVLWVFLLVSTFHLGKNVTLVVTPTALWSVEAAKSLLIIYMVLEHLPAHYSKVKMSAARVALLAAFGLALEMVGFRPLQWPRVTTALVAGHAAVGLSQHLPQPHAES